MLTLQASCLGASWASTMIGLVEFSIGLCHH